MTIPCKEYIPEPNQRNRCNGDISGCLVDLEKRQPRVPPSDLGDLMHALQHSDDFAEIPTKR